MEHQDEGSTRITFKRAARRPARRRSSSSEGSGSDSPGARLGSAKQLQQLRRRPNGVSAAELATPTFHKDKDKDDDPFKTKSGGLLDLAKARKAERVDDAYDTGIGTQFSAETNKRDEDEEMMKYIDEQLLRRKGGPEEAEIEVGTRYLAPEEAALQALPAHLRQAAAPRSEEMLSNQMLSGIPEVDLGIHAKIRNIEATEDAKLRLVWAGRRLREGPSPFVPTNMAVNFVQHDRFNIDPDVARRKRPGPGQEPPPEQPPRGAADGAAGTGGRPPKKDKGERATDDYHYEKFKKQFRRY